MASSHVGHVCVFTILAAKATRSKGQNMKPGSMLPLTMSNIREIKLVDRINCMHVTCLSGCYPPLQHGHPPPLSGFAHQSIVSPPKPRVGAGAYPDPAVPAALHQGSTTHTAAFSHCIYFDGIFTRETCFVFCSGCNYIYLVVCSVHTYFAGPMKTISPWPH